MKILQVLLKLGITDKLMPYERRRAKVFNYCNLAGFSIAGIRVLYLAFLSHNHYTAMSIGINTIPLILCVGMSICMLSNQYKAAVFISFLCFPPALAAMAFVTDDKGLEVYLFLYMIFAFFFLHHRARIVITFCWLVAWFVIVHFSLQNMVFYPPYVYPFDVPLSVLNYGSGLLFIFITLYFIKFEVWKFEQSLREKKEELKKLNVVKDKVFSVISHDLRLPVGAILLLLRQLIKNGASADEVKAYLPEIAANMEQTGELLDNLLAWAKSQMQDSNLMANEFSMSNLAQQTVNFMGGNAAKKNIRLVNDIGIKCSAFADEGSTKIVLRNLLANAIKFTKPGGYVRLRSELNGEYLNILVEDNGVGIPPEKQQLLFGEGYFTSVGTNKESGTGLGLLICKDLVTKNGGSMEFTSKPGNGSTFSFSLPAHN
jgi:two-component system, sensor histidine kinase and response regulator